MNKKNIAKALNSKLTKWCASIDDENVQKIIKKNTIITGGAIVSLLNGEEVNDYDVYFKTKEACIAVIKYYADKWNKTHETKVQVIHADDDPRVQYFITSQGIAEEAEEVTQDNMQDCIDNRTEPQFVEEKEEVIEEKPVYRPRYFSTNAVSLSDKIQIIIRFYGDVETIHENCDFVHCTCSYDWNTNTVNLPAEALETIINKELRYVGSKYPLCSIIRTRKFIQRGYTINAGQYLKICLQLNELDLKDFKVLKDQLVGVDSLYFNMAMDAIEKKKEKDPDFEVDNTYLFEVINRIF